MKTSLTFFLLLLSIYLHSGVHITKLSTENGLSNNNVVSIAQDKDGFIWICTKNGLNRFDGNKFEVFRQSEINSNSIGSNFLNYVFADPFDDVVWIANEKNGLDAYNYRTRRFEHFRHNDNERNSLSSNGITHICSDPDGNIWLATYSTGIDVINRKTGQIRNFNQTNTTGLGSNYNWYVMTDGLNKLYVGHVVDGFSIIDLKTNTAVNYRHSKQNPNSLCDNTVTCIFKDSENRIWLGTRNGLSLFNPQSETFISFVNNSKNQHSISGNFIKSIIETSENELWIGTEGNGISILDLKQIHNRITPEDIKFSHIGVSNTDDGLSGSSVQTLIQDSFGNFWAGGFINGISFISNRRTMFQKIVYQPYEGNFNSLAYPSVVGLYTDTNDNVWLANGAGGLAIYNKKEKIKGIRSIPLESNTLNVSSLAMDNFGNMWLGTSDGKLYKHDYKSGKIRKLALTPSANTAMYYMHFDSKNTIWIGSDGGVYALDTQTEKIRHFCSQNSSLSDNNIRSIGSDAKGQIWIGTLIGALQVFDVEFNLISNIGNEYNFISVNHIFKDSKNRMWICTHNDLYLFDEPGFKLLHRIGKQQGLADNVTCAINEGNSSSEFWISTLNGISFLNISNGQLLNYNSADGIATGDYMKGATTKTNSGSIYFGNQLGATVFDISHSEDPGINISPKITALLVADKTNEFFGGFISVPFAEIQHLTHTQNSLQIFFNVLDFSLNNKIEFKYQILGIDESWYNIGKDKFVTFRNLRPGKYTFSVKSRIQNKEWSDDVAHISFIIYPPLWLTWWAKTIYFVIVLLITIQVIRFYKKRLILENSLLLEKSNHERELLVNEERMRFFTNIAHELRTPMTLIIGPLEDLVNDKTIKRNLSEKIKSIQTVANRLLYLINQILEFRKTETGNRTLNVRKSNIVSLVYEVGLRYKELQDMKKVSFTFDLPKHAIEIYYDSEIITLILDNLISNAFKYTMDGSVKLSVRELVEDEVEYVEIKVSDTGIGITKEDIPLIFNRYFQAENRPQHITGTGIGLSLVKKLIEQHEAEIDLESDLNEGSTFTIRLLANNSYPGAIHFEDKTTELDDDNSSEKLIKKVVLVVEDNSEILKYITECLNNVYEVITAENGQKGYEIASRITPDIIVSDIIMPVMDGIQLCKNIKNNVLTSHIPIILLTAKSSIQDKETGYIAGADSYITKPFSGNLLKSRIRNLLIKRSKIMEQNNAIKEKTITLNESANLLDIEFIERLTSIIEKSIMDENLNTNEIAASLHMSYSTLFRKTKALTELTLNEFIRKVRMRVAERLILTSKYHINEIMYQVGFNSSRYFRECFKEEFGLTPSEYIQRIKENNTRPSEEIKFFR